LPRVRRRAPSDTYSVRRSLPTSAVQTLVVSLALTLDSANAVLIDLPAYLLRRFQTVMNAAARNIVCLSRSAHVGAALAIIFRKTYTLPSSAYNVLPFQALRHVNSYMFLLFHQ
jgi:hypothetical protein